MAKRAKEKQPKRVVLEKRFAGIPAGATLFIATPSIVADYITAIPPGEVRTVERMRRDLATRNRADASCPVSTAIFVRSVAEVALKRLADGEAAAAVVPFWRLVEPGTPIAQRLGLEADWISGMRAMDVQAQG